MKSILFTPVGSTDPVRGCYDGACLHIIRWYHPDKIVVYYSKEMGDRELQDHRYTRGIHYLAPNCLIEEIYSGIKAPHLYDEFITVFSEIIHRIHKENSEDRIIVNLSSGTPQMKTVLAILSTEYDWCLGVQVSSPEKRSNVANNPVSDNEDIDILLECNFDNERGAENRCSEPPLNVIRYYREKYQIMSMVTQYEYSGALTLAKKSRLISEETIRLLQHAQYRSGLMTDAAEKVLKKCDGEKLFPVSGICRKLVEYLLIMQINENKGEYADFMVKITPFLFEYFQEYVKKNIDFSLKRYIEKRKLMARKMNQDPLGKDLLYFLNNCCHGNYRDSDLSFLLLHEIVIFASQQHKIINQNMQDALQNNVLIQHINDLRYLRNETAHEITNINREKFVEKVGLQPKQIMKSFWNLLEILYGTDIVNIRSTYDIINNKIEKSLEEHVEN